MGWMMRRYDEYVAPKLLTPEEERGLGERSVKGDLGARDVLLTKNLRLVLFIVASIHKKYKGVLTFDDLVSEGVMGLMEGVNRFDPDKGAKLSSYASWWIRQAIRKRIVEEDTPMRVPCGVGQHRKRLIALMGSFREENGFYPNAEELMPLFPNVSKKKLRALMEIASVVSLDMPITEGEADSMGGIVEDKRAERPDVILQKKGNNAEVDRLLECLDERERMIIEDRFGLGGQPAMTLEQVSDKVDRTRERVRQIQRTAIKKMRKNLD